MKGTRDAPESSEGREETRDVSAPTSDALTPTAPSEQGGAQPSRPPAVGAVIDRYTVLEPLGAGGMGEVYAAFDKKLDRKVALKLLRQRSEEYEARLMREAQAMARLLHPNVVAVFDTGMVGSRLYLAMEFVRGETLRAWQKEPHTLPEILHAYREAGEGLAAAHAVGLVHRDFKPDNVLIAVDGRVKVTDFGIARATGERTPQASPRKTSRPPPPSEAASTTAPRSTGTLETPMTEEGIMLGTPGYMAPEQILCEAVDERTDQFAFCVSLYEALYGVRPFGGGLGRHKFPQVADATLKGRIDPPPKGSSVPAHIRALLLRGLSTDREARYPSMRALLAELGRDPRVQRRRRLAVAAAALLTVVAGASVAVGTARHRATLRAACRTEGSAIYTHWGGAERDALRAAMLADDAPRVKDRTERTLKGLDSFAEAWNAEQEASCTATRLSKTQAEQVYEKRGACLLGARQRFDAVVDILSEHDAVVHRRALDVLGRALLPAHVCTGREEDRSQSPLPLEPARRAQVEEARRLAMRAEVMGLSGRFKAATALAEKSAKMAHEVDMPSDEAVALVIAASNYSKQYDSVGGTARAREALTAAERTGSDHTVAYAAAALAFELGNRQERFDDAETWLDLGWAKLARIHKDDFLEMKLQVTTAALAYARADFARAVEANGRAVELTRNLLGMHSRDLCVTLSNRAAFMLSAGDPAGALAAAREATACEKEVGDSPDLGFAYKAAGWALYALGRFAEAGEELHHAAEARLELGASDPPSTEALALAALTDVGLGRLEQGESGARDVLRVIESRGVDIASRENHAMALLALGKARAGAGDVAGARTECGRAVAELDEAKRIAPAQAYDVDPLLCLAEAELRAGDVASARSHLERCITLEKRVVPGDLARARFALARALAAPPMPDLSRARLLAAQACEELRRDARKNATLAPVLAEAEAWLAEHPEVGR